MIKNGENVSAVRYEFARLLKEEKFVKDKSSVKTVEIINANFSADESFIFGTVNDDYIGRELAWYKTMSLHVKDIPGEIPKIWKEVASTEGRINSNYGWCIWSPENFDQYYNCMNTLKKDPNSRRAIMIYTRPKMQLDYNRNGMSDFMCTNTVQYLIRDEKLHAIVNMRSNDAIFGYKNDYAWQKYVIDLLSKHLGVPVGTIHWCVGSLHVYERHFNLIKEWAPWI